MLAVSFIGKKFSCSAQFEVAPEKNGNRITLNLRISDRCSQHLKPPGPVLATLHVSINNGRPNNISKCKELLTFLKEQVLPRTIKFIGVQGIKIEKNKNESENVSLLSCIWPGKSKKRVETTKGKTKTDHGARGYFSDSESYTQKSFGKTSLSDNDLRHPAHPGIPATSRLAHAQLLRRNNATTREDKEKKVKSAAKSKAENALANSTLVAMDKTVKKTNRSPLMYHVRAKSDLEVSDKSIALKRRVSDIYKEIQPLDLNKCEEKTVLNNFIEQKKAESCVEIETQNVQKDATFFCSDSDILPSDSPRSFRHNKAFKHILKARSGSDQGENGWLKTGDSQEVDNLTSIWQNLAEQDSPRSGLTTELPSRINAHQTLETFAAEYVKNICRTALEQICCNVERERLQRQEAVMTNTKQALDGATKPSESSSNSLTTSHNLKATFDKEKSINQKSGDRIQTTISHAETKDEIDLVSFPETICFVFEGNEGKEKVKLRCGGVPLGIERSVEIKEDRQRDRPSTCNIDAAANQLDFSSADSLNVPELQHEYLLHVDEDGSQYLHLDTDICATNAPHKMARNISRFSCASLEAFELTLEECVQAEKYGTNEYCINCGHQRSKPFPVDKDISIENNACARKRWSICDTTDQSISIYDTAENIRDKLQFSDYARVFPLCGSCSCFVNYDMFTAMTSSLRVEAQTTQPTFGLYSIGTWDRHQNIGPCEDPSRSVQLSSYNLLHQFSFSNVSVGSEITEPLPLVNGILNEASSCDETRVQGNNAMQNRRKEYPCDKPSVSKPYISSHLGEIVRELEDGELTSENAVPSLTEKADVLIREDELQRQEHREALNHFKVKPEDDSLACSRNTTTSEITHCADDETKASFKPALKKITHSSNKQQAAGGRSSILFRRAISENLSAERKRWSSSEPVDEKCTRPVSSRLETKATKIHARSSPRPVLSQKLRIAPSTTVLGQRANMGEERSWCMMGSLLSLDDVVIEGLVNHHQDIYDSLAKRTWIILHIHGLWNAGRPMDAVKTCIELTGMSEIEEETEAAPRFYTPYTLVTRDYALFLNILLQLPISCSMWTLDLCVLVLPKLKGFISVRHHTSHVEMACSILHIVIRKVTAGVRRESRGPRNKEKTKIIRDCAVELKEIKEKTSDVIVCVKPGGRNSTEDPGSMRLVLKELHLALGICLGSLGTI